MNAMLSFLDIDILREGSLIQPETRLLWAMLKVAIIDFIYPELHFASTPKDVRENRRTSKSFFLNPRILPYPPFSFPWVVEHLFPEADTATLCDEIVGKLLYLRGRTERYKQELLGPKPRVRFKVA